MKENECFINMQKEKKPASFEITLILNNDVISVYSMLSNCYNVTPTKLV